MYTAFGLSLIRHFRAGMVALILVGVATTSNAMAAPTTVTLSHHTKPLAASECSQIHAVLATSNRATSAERAWGRSSSTADCAIESETTAQVSPNSALAWDGCYNRQSSERIVMTTWPYAWIAVAYMNYGLCWTQSQIEVSWTSCWVNTGPAFGGGWTFCGGAPTSAGSWCAAEEDWYYFPYNMFWWHQNHGFRDTWSAPLWMTGQQQW
jgi:hypothetical protein